MNVAQSTAEAIVKEFYDYHPDLQFAIQQGPEPYRAIMYHTSVIDGEAIDGTEAYHEIVDCLPDELNRQMS